MQKNVDGDQIVPSAKAGKGRLGWQTPKPTSEGSTPDRSTETPSKMPSDPKLSEALRPQGAQKSTQEAQLEKYPSQTKNCKQWEAEMERLNSKYNLDCFSNSELDSESDEGEQYQYEHGFETLI